MSPEPELVLRSARPKDEALLLEWRNEPVTRSSSFSDERISPEAHHAWLTRKLGDFRCALLIIEEGSTPVGQVRLDLLETGIAQISIGLAPEARGRGIARRALLLALAEAHERLDAHTVQALVKPGNEASLRAFSAAGFEQVRVDAGVVALERPV